MANRNKLPKRLTIIKVHLCVALTLLLGAPLATPRRAKAEALISLATTPGENATRSIFERERRMIAGLTHTKPLLETYIQSIWPESKGQSPIDDAYFLSRVDFTRGYKDGNRGRRGRQVFMFGGTPSSRQIRVNNGEKWNLYPDGYLDMLFVDLESFEADTYDLTYLRNETFDDIACFVYSVNPKRVRQQGQFKGQIWVESANLKIIRIKGTFTAPAVSLLRRIAGGSIPIYLNFDSIRQEVTPGNWLPAYTFFDENRTWRELNHNGETDFHYRGHTFIWHYQTKGSGNISDYSNSTSSLTKLENDGLLATQGPVEEELNEDVKKVTVANKIDVPDIECRVLLTTPLEMYHIGHTIILSRGLLNIIPDDSVLPVLLSYEVAKIHLEDAKIQTGEQLTAHRADGDDTVAWSMAVGLAKQANYSEGVKYTSALLLQLAGHSPQIPNLILDRFGPSVLRAGSAGLTTDSPSSQPLPLPLSLRGKYTINSWTGRLKVRD